MRKQLRNSQNTEVLLQQRPMLCANLHRRTIGFEAGVLFVLVGETVNLLYVITVQGNRCS